MDDQTLKILLWIGGGVVTVINILVAFIMRRLLANVDRNAEEVTKLKGDFGKLKLSILQTHPTKEEFIVAVKDIKHQMERGFDSMQTTTVQMKDTIAKIFDKLEKKEDRKA